MKVYTRNDERTITEMSEMWNWMVDNFGVPASHNDDKKRWAYGKDTKSVFGCDTILNGTWEIEWFNFRDEKDATMFMLRWS